MAYLEFVGEIDQHDSARRLFARSRVEADGSDHVHATALDEVVICSKFEDLDSAHDSRFGDSQLIS